jgi:hypothetical protein
MPRSFIPVVLLAKASLSVAVAMFVPAAFAADRVFFESPVDGATVTSPLKVKFGLEGMKIAPLGDMTDKTGHHHLIINGNVIKAGETVPADEKHLHFGKGQTETEITLPPGKYTLTLQFGNGAHQSYGPGMSKSITVTVVAPK